MSAHHARMSSRRWEATRHALFERDGWKLPVVRQAPAALEAHHRRPSPQGRRLSTIMKNLMATLSDRAISLWTRAQRRPPVAGQADWRALAASGVLVILRPDTPRISLRPKWRKLRHLHRPGRGLTT